MVINNATIVALGVTSMSLMILLVFPYALYARDMKDHLRTGKTFLESVTTTIIWHLLLTCFLAFFFGSWKLLTSNLDSMGKYSPQQTTTAFLNVGNESDLKSYWSSVTKELANLNYSDGTNLSQKSRNFVSYGVSLIAAIGIMYWVVLFFLPILCITTPIFLSLRYDKLHRDNNDGTIMHKFRYLTYGIAGYVIMGLHFKINDTFIYYLLGDNSKKWIGLHEVSQAIWKSFL